jgi:hypothetical protein
VNSRQIGIATPETLVLTLNEFRYPPVPNWLVGIASHQRCERGGKALNWFCTQPLSRYRKKLKLFGCRTPSVEVPGVAAYGTSYRLVRSDAQLAGRAVALLSNG